MDESQDILPARFKQFAVGFVDNSDLLRRYCPGLQNADAIAAHLAQAPNGCWLWPASITQSGYGTIPCEPTPYGYKGHVPAHRYMYNLLVGPVTPEFYVHHRCKVKHCWHPLHLEAVTPKEHSAIHKEDRQKS